MKKIRLPESERFLMEILWKSEVNLSITKIHKATLEEKSLSMSTVRTMLDRLIEKGFVVKEGKYFLPIKTPEKYRVQETKEFLEEVHGNSLSMLMASLSGNMKLTPEEIEELQKWLDEEKAKCEKEEKSKP